MSRQLFYFSVLSLTLSACSSVDSKRAQGDFDYAKKQESKEFIVPKNLDQPATQQEFLITNKINHQGSIGNSVDIRAPSLVLPIAASSRVIAGSHDAIIWFDKTLEDKDLLAFIQKALVSQLTSDEVSYEIVGSSTQDEPGSKKQSKTEIYESDWYNSQVETGWLFTDIESSTSLRFRYEFFLKPHGRSVSLKVSLIEYMKTDNDGGSKIIDPIDKQRAEMLMLNEIVAQVDYNYRLQQRENRLMRANQKLVAIGENSDAAPAYVVEMGLDNLWENMPIFFEKHGFTISDLNESDKIYYVDFSKPDISIWDGIWGNDRPIIDVSDAKYKFVLAPLDDKNRKTSVSIYNVDGESLPLETLERIFPVMETGLSFRNIY
uniref:Outer membrane protein NlpB, lipoprotein component of the protein assembly complex n=1 Tax=Colwellia sp. C1 TaxID=1737566 RepID=A0A168PHL6_9GAMM|nr:Outer membrane protein NlpB, lipoprotein component of the protein assembly complex [Colwellia sp. C1]